METGNFLRLFILFFSAPFIFLSRIAEIANAWKIRDDIERCLEAVDAYGEQVPSAFIAMLIAAEDHRSCYHLGVDPIGILRALYVYGRRRTLQGASTIEQQFVRIITNRYKRTIIRKLREQALAVAVSRRRSKRKIASAYLALAFYGTGCVGLSGLKSLCGHELDRASKLSALSMIARLKYPKPSSRSAAWQRIHRARIEYITHRQLETHTTIQLTSLSVAALARQTPHH